MKWYLKNPNPSVTVTNWFGKTLFSHIHVCIYIYLYMLPFSVYPPYFLIPEELHLKLAAGERQQRGHWMLRGLGVGSGG